MMDAFNNFLNAALEICESAWGKAHRRNSLRSVGRDGVSQKKTSHHRCVFSERVFVDLDRRRSVASYRRRGPASLNDSAGTINNSETFH
jgi:hypothetical protein